MDQLSPHLTHTDQNDHRDLLAAYDRQTSPLEAKHLVRLPQSRWMLWNCAALRATGFPACDVLTLADTSQARAADAALRKAEEKANAFEHALIAINSALDTLRAQGKWEDELLKDPLLHARQRLKRDAPVILPLSPDIDQAITLLQQCSSQYQQAYQDYRQQLDARTGTVKPEIVAYLHIQRFREAVTWQNHHALHALEEGLHGQTSHIQRSSKRRQAEELIASYIQRYCVKNDTIGFFGPVGWVTLNTQGDAVTAQAGADLLATRRVYFEGWTIDALVNSLAADTSLTPCFAPQLLPFVHLTSKNLSLPGRKVLPISAQQTALLEQCNGTRSAYTIAVSLVQQSIFHDEDTVYAHIESFVRQQVLSWTLTVPSHTYPERMLRTRLQQNEHHDLRARGLQALDALENERAAITRAVGDAKALEQALNSLEHVFSRITGQSAQRAAGQMYAGRTLVYEDCRRDLQLTIGPDVLDRLGPPLDLLLYSARWFTAQVALSYRDLLWEIYEDLSYQQQSSTIDLTSIWYHMMPLLRGDSNDLVAEVRSAFQQHWSDIFALPMQAHRVQFGSEDLRQHVYSTFHSSVVGWRTARHHSPDIMIDAESVEAIRQGDYQLVLGEFHMGINTLRGSLFVSQHPDPEDLYAAFDADFPEPLLMPAMPKQWKKLTARTSPILKAAKDYTILLTHDSSSEDAHTLPISALVVEAIDGALLVRTHAGDVLGDLLDAFGFALSLAVSDQFKLLPSSPHMPRVTIDHLVVCRETWRFSQQECAFAFEHEEHARFLALRAWVHEAGLPRWVFVKTPEEEKPFFVDFESLVYVNILAKVIRRVKMQTDVCITLSEMLPTPSHCWVPDATGHRYSSELRMIAVDPCDRCVTT